MKNLKLLFLLGLFITLFSCSTNNDSLLADEEPVPSNYFNPPSWIQGTWRVNGTTTSYMKFTSDDFILLSPYTSYKALLTQTASTGQKAKVIESVSANDYNFTIIAGMSEGTYKFKKLNSTQVQIVNTTGQTLILVKQ